MNFFFNQALKIAWNFYQNKIEKQIKRDSNGQVKRSPKKICLRS